ncbi:MAG: 50S ribosomal protein L5 [Candidatus Heimdallarchaeum aukensis]|uniref:Large ribosomal subunit protein uL5 n=1 Tax=Candidatus Heimdallarchaeum aukensis TaxID=2876573 RepID=A0A9Y1FKD8_9ARCH|nr:MAG: 50S ribosomal protein L5 [Candidatus Heimdallarchaeum aukensis]
MLFGEPLEEVEIEEKYSKEWEKHPMRKPYLKEVILNAAVGESGPRFERAKTILSQITGRVPSERPAKKSIRDFGIRKGEPIAAIVTLRGEEAKEMLDRCLYAKDYIIKQKAFDQQGNFSFGITEHVDIRDAPFDPMLGTIGFNVVVKLERPGYRLKYRRNQRKKIPKKHLITKEEAMEFASKEFNIKIVK